MIQSDFVFFYRCFLKAILVFPSHSSLIDSLTISAVRYAISFIVVLECKARQSTFIFFHFKKKIFLSVFILRCFRLDLIGNTDWIPEKLPHGCSILTR